jgi:light-regulated signal transduction histidine kinase (bacteriophytochrome)
MRGKFITLEGMDGAGKSSHVAWIAEWLRVRGHRVKVTERLHDEDKIRWTEDAAETFSLRTPLDGTYRFVARDGSTVWIRGHVKIVHNAAGEPEFMHGVGFDVTESKLAEIERSRLRVELERQVAERTAELSKAQVALQRYAAELERSNEDLEQFAYVASHDLQEPLRTLITFSYLLEENLSSRGGLSEDGQRYLQFIANASGHMRQLVDDLLSLSRVGRAELNKTPIDLDRLVKEILLRLDDNVRRTGADLKVGELGEVLADERLLAQALQNLVANALKFSDEKAPKVHITTRHTGDATVVGVRDNGIGIDPRHFDVIFAPFRRLNKKRYEGTGIGLAICRKVAELHRGRLWVESAPGKGAFFQLTLPLE